MKYQCICGKGFSKPMHLREHIGICNPHWPRSNPDDEHGIAANGVRVIRDCRDASRDYYLPAHAAHAKFRAGQLDYDITNGCYATK